MANFRMAQAFEKLNQPDDAVDHYSEYLRILPNGPLSEEAKKSMAKLKAALGQRSSPAVMIFAARATFGQRNHVGTDVLICPAGQSPAISASVRTCRALGLYWTDENICPYVVRCVRSISPPG